MGVKARVSDPDKNLLRIVFFIIGLVTGITLTDFVQMHPQTAPAKKLLYNQCSRMTDGTSSCGLRAEPP